MALDSRPRTFPIEYLFLAWEKCILATFLQDTTL